MLQFVSLSRRRFVLILATCVALWTTAASAQSERWKDRIRELAAAHQGKVAVAISRPASKESFFLNEKEPMPTASLIKLSVMIEAYRQSEAGKVDLKKLVTLKEEDKVPGSGILTQHFTSGMQLSVRDSI